MNAAGRLTGTRRVQESNETPAIANVPSPFPLTLVLGTPFNIRKSSPDIPTPGDIFSDRSKGRGDRLLSIRRRIETEQRISDTR